MTGKKKLSVLLLGWGSLSRFLPLTAPACEYDKRKLTVLCIQGGYPAVNIVFRMLPELDIDKTKVRVGGIELTSANTAQAREILEKLADICGCPDREGFVSEKLSLLEKEKYRKFIPLELDADIPEITDPEKEMSGIPASASSLFFTQMPENPLYRFISDKNTAEHINELTLCFRMSPLLARELANGGYGELELREAKGFVQGEAQLKDTTRLHLTSQRSDVVFLADMPFADILTDSRLGQLRALLSELPAAAVKSHSDRLEDIEEYKDDPEELRKAYLSENEKITGSNITALYDKLGLRDPLTGRKDKPFAIGLSAGAELNDYGYYGALFAYAAGLTAEKLRALYSTDITGSAELLRPCAKELAERIAGCEKYDLIGFLRSDRPLIHPNGGITMKSHNKYRFAESCELAVMAYETIYRAADSEPEKMTDAQRTLLRGALLRYADSYALYEGKTLIGRYELVKAAEDARNSGAEDISAAFAENVVSGFIGFVRGERRD